MAVAVQVIGVPAGTGDVTLAVSAVTVGDVVNVAVTDRFWVMLTTQEPVPEQAAPQAVSVPLVTESVTDVPAAKFATQVPDEQLPEGLLETVPVPVTVTESV